MLIGSREENVGRLRTEAQEEAIAGAGTPNARKASI
jgi:hypothetical protein